MAINPITATHSLVSERLIDDAHELVSGVFGPEHVDFAFIAGSIAKFTAKSTSDVDIVVGLREPPTSDELVDFRAGYYDLHATHGLLPDDEYPGEVFGLDKLFETIDYADSRPPSGVLSDLKIYDGIVWAGMLSADKILLIPQTKTLEIAIEAGSQLVSKYHDFIEHDCRYIGGHKGFDLCLKELIEYHAL